MEPVRTDAAPTGFRIFKTNQGAHSPETLAEMTICQLMDEKQSNPVKVAALTDHLISVHAAVQRMIRRIYELSPGMDDVAMRAVNTVIARDVATSLDIERQHALLRK
jgi:hypothetical protein